LQYNYLLLNDVNFCKNSTPKTRYARTPVIRIPEKQPQDILPQEDYSSYSVEELFEFIVQIRAKICDGTIEPNDFQELMEIAETIYDNGTESDREKLLNTINSLEKECYQDLSPSKRRRKLEARQPELF
jgi:hypothetical protein